MRTLLLAGTAALLGACSLLDEEAYVRYPGALEYYTQPAMISVPDSVRVGESFTVIVTTYGTGCSDVDRTQTTQDGLEAWVTPYDINRMSSGSSCDSEQVLTHEHVATFRFTQAGTAKVNIYGIRLPSQQQIAFRRTLVVY